MKKTAVLVVIAASGCATLPPALTPEGKGVFVYTAPLDGPAASREMPDGCRKLDVAQAEDWMSELEMEGRAEPFRKQRNAAGAAGANALLVLKRLTGAR